MRHAFIHALSRWLTCTAALLAPALAWAQAYTASSEPYSWTATTGHSIATWTKANACSGGGAAVDDDITNELPIGFTFTFGGVGYTTLRIMSNGRLQFSNTFCGFGTSSTSVPRTYPYPYPDGNLNRTLRIYGADLDPGAGGTVTYAATGSAPNRTFIVTWTNVPEWNASGSAFNLQVVLYEQGDFVYRYGTSSNPTQGKATIGWQISTSSFASYSYNSLGSLANTAIRWSAPQSPSSIGSFNAFDTATSAGSVTGNIRTKVAGQAFTIDIAAVNLARTGYSSAAVSGVRIELLDASNNSGALDAVTNCRSSWSALSTLTTTFSLASTDNGRKSFTTTVAGAYRQVRLRVSWPANSPTQTGCSTDAFAVRPAAFATVQARDADAQSAGTVRVLDNASATSGVVHRAGRPFTLQAVAVGADGNVVTGYDGSPVATASCLQPTGCTAGALAGTLAASNGAITGTLTYAEAGVIGVALEDTSFAAVDAADGSTTTERAIRTTAAVTVGRFVPDRYLITPNTPAFAAACGAANLTFTGQPFGFGTLPTAVATPLNADGQALANARPRFTTGMVTVAVTATGAPTALQGSIGSISVSQSATSFISVGSSSFSFTRSSAPSAPYTPAFTLRVRVDDTTETNGGTLLTLSGEGTTAFGFGPSHLVHYGRLALRPAYGDARQDLVLPLELQSFNGSGWVPLTSAASCVAPGTAQFAYSAARGSLATAGAFNCASSVASVTAASGRWAVRLPRPALTGGVAEGAMNVQLNTLATASGQVCSGSVPAAATSTLASPWLAQPDGSNPVARVQWGRSRGDFVQMREVFD